MVAVRAEYKGKGIGSFAVENCLKELRKAKTACRLLALTTQLPENVSFYSKTGFTKTDEGFVSFKGNKYYNCNMIYDFN